jgi:hypothetical protein
MNVSNGGIGLVDGRKESVAARTPGFSNRAESIVTSELCVHHHATHAQDALCFRGRENANCYLNIRTFLLRLVQMEYDTERIVLPVYQR